ELANRKAVSARELGEYPLVGALNESMFGQLIETALRKVGIARPHFITRLQDPAGIAAVVRTGIGVACTPRCNIEADVKTGLLKLISPYFEPARLQIRLAYAPGSYVSNVAQRFVTHFLKHCKNDAPASSTRHERR